MSERPVNLPPETQTTSFKKRNFKEIYDKRQEKVSRKKRIVYEAKKGKK